ncbi:unnamed protein product [Chrysoparadoxa australica]
MCRSVKAGGQVWYVSKAVDRARKKAQRPKVFMDLSISAHQPLIRYCPGLDLALCETVRMLGAMAATALQAINPSPEAGEEAGMSWWDVARALIHGKVGMEKSPLT